jgi:nitrogen fixation NifU-like protein
MAAYHDKSLRGKVLNPDFQANINNKSCGDSIEITGSFCSAEKKIKEILFSAEGCILSEAAATLLLKTIKYLSIQEIEEVTDKAFLDKVGLNIGPNRSQCVLLCLEAVRQALFF